MASFISPVRPIDTAPPWDWNPGATFAAAFNESRLAQKKAEEMELSNQLESILLPYKQKQAALALDKLQFDVELQSERLDREREVFREMRKQGFGSGSNAAGNTVQGGVYQSRYGFGSKLLQTAPIAPQNTSRKIGSGVTPKQ